MLPALHFAPMPLSNPREALRLSPLGSKRENAVPKDFDNNDDGLFASCPTSADKTRSLPFRTIADERQMFEDAEDDEEKSMMVISEAFLSRP